MLPSFGCRIHELMFSPSTQVTATLISRHVSSALARWEPRIEVLEVKAWPDSVGKMRVQVKYQIRSTRSEQELTMMLSGG